MRKTPLFTGDGASAGEGWDARFGDFLVALFFEEGLAESTMTTLQAQLQDFTRWLLEAHGTTWDLATVDQLRGYFLQVQDSLSVASLRSKQWALMRLYSWARQEGHAEIDAEKAFIPTRAPSRPTANTLALHQVLRLLEQPDTGTPDGIRDRAILELLYSTGLRSAELLGLDQHQVSQGACVRVMGKGLKERLVILGEHALHWIAQYKDMRKFLLQSGGHLLSSTERLFVSSNKYPDYRYHQLRRMVWRYAQKSGLQLTPHTLRHTFATHMYQGKAPLKTIQLLMGHEHLETTTIYVSRHNMDDKALHRRHHPRELDYRRFVRWANH